jgi:hypothetical protein
MEDDRVRDGFGHLANRIEGLEAQLVQLRRQVNRSSDTGKLDQNGTDSMDGTRCWLSPEEQTAELESLASWVDELQRQYAAAGDWLVPCWCQHGFAVNELIALRTAWLGVDSSDEPGNALEWHEAAEKCRERIRQAIGDGPGCTAVEHYPDRAVTEDRRWIEERRLLIDQLRQTRIAPTPDGKSELSSRAG